MCVWISCIWLPAEARESVQSPGLELYLVLRCLEGSGNSNYICKNSKLLDHTLFSMLFEIFIHLYNVSERCPSSTPHLMFDFSHSAPVHFFPNLMSFLLIIPRLQLVLLMCSLNIPFSPVSAADTCKDLCHSLGHGQSIMTTSQKKSFLIAKKKYHSVIYFTLSIENRTVAGRW